MMLTLRDLFFLRTSIADILRISSAPPIFCSPWGGFPTFSTVQRNCSGKMIKWTFQRLSSRAVELVRTILEVFTKVESLRSPKYFPLLVERILNQLASIFDRNPLLVSYYFWEVSADTQVPTESNIARLPIGTLFSSHALKKSESWIGRRELDGMFLGKKSCGETRNGTSEVDF